MEMIHRLACSWIVLNTLVLTPFTVLGEYPTFGLNCPVKGCTPHGTSSFHTPVPTSMPQVEWSWADITFRTDRGRFHSKGCSSSFSTLICPTERGYISIDPSNGHVMWNTTTMMSPNLAMVDFLGNAVVSDGKEFHLTTYDGLDQNRVDISQYSSLYGPVSSYDHTILVTSSRTDTPQLLTYNTLGATFASTTLKGQLANESGTFVPCGPPVTNGNRAYVITRFSSDVSTSSSRPRELQGAQRLYAIDLSGDRMPNTVAWYCDIPTDSINYYNDHHMTSNLAFHKDTVYVNYVTQPRNPTNNTGKHSYTMSPMIALQDHGNTATVTWNQFSFLGPMAIYDVTETWTNMTVLPTKTVWVVNRSPAVIFGHDLRTGHVRHKIAVADLSQTADGLITSDVMVTRNPGRPDTDVLIFATQNVAGRAYVLAVETESRPRLLWVIDVSGPIAGRETEWMVEGQMASVALPGDGSWRFGIAVALTGCGGTGDAIEGDCTNAVRLITDHIDKLGSNVIG